MIHCSDPRYQLITPLYSQQFEKPVLVNRGWVPATWRSDAEIRQQWESKGSDNTLQAVTRVSEDPSSFVPQNNPKTGEWFWIDVPAMAASLDLPSDTPLVEAGSLISAGFCITLAPASSDVPSCHERFCLPMVLFMSLPSCSKSPCHETSRPHVRKGS